MTIHRGTRKAGWKKKLRHGAARLPKPMNIFRSMRGKKMISYNPGAGETARKDADKTQITVFTYSTNQVTEKTYPSVEEIFYLKEEQAISWINIDGLVRKQVNDICNHFHVHQLTIDDILSVGQRAKMDDLDEMIYCLLPMMYFNEECDTVESEQVSLLLTKNVVISFQEDMKRDAFNPVREKLRMDNSRLRTSGVDALFNALLDAIVDQYFIVIEKIGLRIEDLEEFIIRVPDNRTLVRINHFRRETSYLRRAINPVKELIYGIVRFETPLIQKKTKSYFKDIYDHIIQANETADNYRDLIMNLQDLYVNQVSLKMNEIMKVLAVVTALFVPLTLIAGIYGMNFENMPELHTRYGYFITLGIMFIIFVGMLYFFKKRKWF